MGFEPKMLGRDEEQKLIGAPLLYIYYSNDSETLMVQ